MKRPLHRNVQRWLLGYLRHELRRALGRACSGPRHVLFATCDHFEPLWGDASEQVGFDRVERWVRGYPALCRDFSDADGRPPRHTFFFPAEQYQPRLLDGLAELARRGFGEVELHLHHDADTSQALSSSIADALRAYASHGHLARERDGRLRYAFVHGNWALANCRRDGRHCGVDDELSVLFETGCYADFTFPSAPDETQPGLVNALYWPVGDLSRRRAHEHGSPARVGQVMRDRILVIEGPLAPARGGRIGLRIENGALSASDPGSARRVASWAAQSIHIRGLPEWIFVKVHTHGAPEKQAESLLGAAGRVLHRELRKQLNDGERFVLHYVTAREMFNIAIAGMEGHRGDPNAHRDRGLVPPQVVS